MRSLSVSAMRTSLLLFAAAALTAAETETRPDGLIIETTSGPVTCDRPTRVHDTLSIHYKGTLQSDGSEFDQSYKRGKPFQFQLGAGRVIRGWDEGLVGMCIGQSRKLTIPPSLGYGDSGSGPIPPKATLIFETKLMDIVNWKHDENTSGTEENLSIATAPPLPTESDKIADVADILPPDDVPDGPEKQARCHLLGPFALLVQGALGLLAVLTLLYKRWREVPKRPWKIFFFDVSKQLFGSILVHVINLAMSELGSVDMANAAELVAVQESRNAPNGRSPNPCSFYLLNLAIDVSAKRRGAS